MTRSVFICLRSLVIMVFLAVFSEQYVIADVVFESKNIKIVIGDDARWKSVIDKNTGKELCASNVDLPFAEIIAKDGIIPASSLRKIGQNIQLEFGNTGTKLTYAIIPCDDWIHIQLTIVDGTRPGLITLCQIPVNITEHVGATLNIAYDENTAVCLMAGNFQSNCGGSRQDGYAVLKATTQDKPGPPLEGAAVALIVAPFSEIRSVLRKGSHIFGLPMNEGYDGVPSKETLGRQSYWFMTEVKESDAERIIEYCRKTNIKQVMVLFSSWAISAGHIEYNTKNFSQGKESIRRFVKKLNDEGIGVGSHAFVSKVSKKDPYVTPVPDKRFWVDKKTSLAGDISIGDVEIKVTGDLREWPGSPVCSQKRWEGGVIRHQDVIIGDEIIQYKSIGPEGAYNTFLGCQRGAYGTRASNHKAGDRAIHWGVDGGINAYIIDQETNLLDEVCDRMAQAFNECGFNQVYFDGSEDVPRDRSDYYASKAHATAVKKFWKRPFMHMGGARTHRLWHSFAVGGTCDTYMNTLHGAIISGANVDNWPTVRGHINRSVDGVIASHENLFPAEMGWFGIWPKGENTDGLQLDEIEYLMVKSLAYDSPISLETGWTQMDSHPLTPEILNIVGVYEKIRMNREIPEEVCRKLGEKDVDYAYIPLENKYEFVRVEEVPLVGGTHDVRSCIGEMENGDAVATIWHYTGNSVEVQVSCGGTLEAKDIFGKAAVLQKSGTDVTIPVDSRRLALIFRGVKKETARKYLMDATLLR